MFNMFISRFYIFYPVKTTPQVAEVTKSKSKCLSSITIPNPGYLLSKVLPMDLHAIGLSVDAVEIELQRNPHRIEERKSVYGMEYTPLIAAAIDGNFPVVKFLAEHGADINAKTNVSILVYGSIVFFSRWF